jgi:phage terminase large subunit-like protein
METFVKVQHPTKGPVPFVLYEYQHGMVHAIHDHKDTIILASRQLGKTTVVAMYMLWFALFHRSKVCVIASKTMKHATEIMSRVKYAYEELPNWIKAGCKYYNRTSIEFDNGSKIECEATSEKTGRGNSPSILFVDEIAFINRKIQEEMWASLTPSLSTGGKFILTSTPNGDTDLFASLWRGAMGGTNSFFPLQVMWHQHPDRECHNVCKRNEKPDDARHPRIQLGNAVPFMAGGQMPG